VRISTTHSMSVYQLRPPLSPTVLSPRMTAYSASSTGSMIPASSVVPTTCLSTTAPSAGTSPTISSNPSHLVAACRSIHVFGLPYNYSESKLREMLGRYGGLADLKMQRDGKNPGRGKASATAWFVSGQQAASAIRHLGGEKIGGRRIHVRLCKEDAPSSSHQRTCCSAVQQSQTGAAASGGVRTHIQHSRDERDEDTYGNGAWGNVVTTGPLVVNGARGTVGRLDSRDDDDDDEEEEDQDDDGDQDEG